MCMCMCMNMWHLASWAAYLEYHIEDSESFERGNQIQIIIFTHSGISRSMTGGT
jgi:hypothetical protein